MYGRKIGGHYLPHPHLPQGVLPVGGAPRRAYVPQVPIRDEPDEPSALHDRQMPYVPLPAEVHSPSRAILGSQRYDPPGHGIPHPQHPSSSSHDSRRSNRELTSRPQPAPVHRRPHDGGPLGPGGDNRGGRVLARADRDTRSRAPLLAPALFR